ncbi:MAG TPA: D-aminoacyl-tRNA deacylase [Pyrinomonadaceae bacterium]
MRAVLQRVSRASVTVGDEMVGEIGRGILVFLGVARGDTEKDALYLLEKTLNLRIFEDDEGKMNLSLLDISGEFLVVSQFTLYGDVRKGRRPSLSKPPRPSKPIACMNFSRLKPESKLRKSKPENFRR